MSLKEELSKQSAHAQQEAELLRLTLEKNAQKEADHSRASRVITDLMSGVKAAARQGKRAYLLLEVEGNDYDHQRYTQVRELFTASHQQPPISMFLQGAAQEVALHCEHDVELSSLKLSLEADGYIVDNRGAIDSGGRFVTTALQLVLSW